MYQIPSSALESARERIVRSIGTQAAAEPLLYVSITHQRLWLLDVSDSDRSWQMSSSRFGQGNLEGSFQTPLGVHRIVEKYGDGARTGTIFRDRLDTGEVWTPDQAPDNLVLSRILRLAGLEEGINKGAGIDSCDRYIYLHGTSRESTIGTPSSHGCVVLRNADIIELFDAVKEGTVVYIDQ